jgi:hypothetical protein
MTGRLNYCDGCNRRFVLSRPPAPMLRDDVWQELADEYDTLCVGCMFERANERGIYLTLMSLKPLPVNLDCNPWSWFDLFAERCHNNMVPEDFDMEAWCKAAGYYPPSRLPYFFKRYGASGDKHLQLELPL